MGGTGPADLAEVAELEEDAVTRLPISGVVCPRRLAAVVEDSGAS